MTSKELNEILNKTRRTKNIELSAEQVEELVKQLEINEILKKNIKFKYESYGGVLVLNMCLGVDLYLEKETFFNLKEWLDNGKD